MAKYDPKGLVTNEYLDDAVSRVVEGMDKIADGFKGEFSKVYKRFDRVETRLDKIEVGLSEVKDEVQGLKADFSTTVSKSDFNTFKVKMNRFATS